jgi:SAM-dependent methyltransferase
VRDVTYDTIGGGYSARRRADPRIAAQVTRALGGARSVVNVGAGTGSYEREAGVAVAVEPSAVMLRQRPPDTAPVVCARAEHLPLGDRTFDAALAVLTVHHWDDLPAGLAELVRVAPRVVVLTFDPVPHFAYWLLEEYLPEVRELDSARGPPVTEVARVLGANRVEVVPIPADCVDGFNWAYWCRPEAYLDPAVRACISGIALLPEDLVTDRMAQLREDLRRGVWQRRHTDLLTRRHIDGGFRLVVRE